MYVLFDFLSSAWGVIRRVFLWIDSIGLTFIDNAYNLMIDAASAFDGKEVAAIAEDIMRNCYIIIGIFALFRIAIFLVNSIINPDKFNEKGSGVGNMFVRIFVTVILLIAVPVVFNLSRELQGEIIHGNYISKIILGASIMPSEPDKNDAEDIGNPGAYIKDIAVRALIHPDEQLATEVNYGQYNFDQCSEDNKAGCEACNNNAECRSAVLSWNNDAGIGVLTKYISTYVEIDDDSIYAYNYTPFITLIVGGFITYVLLSFAIDIAVRSVELMVLEILAPLFIVTYIDPKSSSSGPFKNWVTTCGKTFVSLFIKIGIVCLMLLLIAQLERLFGTMQGKGFLKLLIVIAILIFAKKAPKWIGDMIGVEGGLGGLGIGKKLGGMALAGGLASKGIEKLGSFGKQKGKNFLGNRVRNAAARIGGMHEQRVKNKENKQLGKPKESIWRAGRVAAKKSRVDNWGQNFEGIKDVSSGFMAGRKLVNPDAKSINERIQARAEAKEQKYSTKVGFDQASMRLRLEAAEDAQKAKIYHGNVAYTNGERNKTLSYQGERETNAALRDKFVDPAGNSVIRTPQTEVEAYLSDMKNRGMVTDLKMNSDGTISSVTTSNGTVMSNMSDITRFVDQYKGTLSLALQDSVKLTTANNAQRTESEYFDAVKQSQELSVKIATDRTNLAAAVTSYNNALSSLTGISTKSVSYTDSTGAHKIIAASNAADLVKAYQSATDPAAKSAIESNLMSVCPNEFLSIKASADNIDALNASVEDTEKRQVAWSEEARQRAETMLSVSKQYVGGKGYEPKDNPLAIEVNGKFVTPVGEYSKDPSGNWVFNVYPPGKASTITDDTFTTGTSEKISKISDKAKKSFDDAQKSSGSDKK